MIINTKATDDFYAHVLKEYPKESVGVIVAGQYIPCENKSENPEDSFRLTAIDEAKIITEHGKIEALLHSHTYSPTDHSISQQAEPSEPDMEQWISDPIPWGIANTNGQGVSGITWLDDNDRPPLIGRKFIWGVSDCYSIVRDYYKTVLNIDLKNIVRSSGWEARGEDHFIVNFERVGFHSIPKKEAKVHDMVVYQVRARTVNHCAVISSPGVIVHQSIMKQSNYQNMADWVFFEKLFMRHKDVA